MELGSNFTPREILNIRGQLPIDIQEDLIEQAEDFANMANIAPGIQEARGSFPCEDFAEDLIDGMRTLAKRMRGDTKAEMLALIEHAEQLQTELAGQAEYGMNELDEVLKVLGA